MPKMTKAAGKKRLIEMEGKAKKLYLSGYISLKDLDAVIKIVTKRFNQLK